MTAAVFSMVQFFTIDCYDQFEAMGYEEAERVAMAAADISGANELLYLCGKRERFELPHFGSVSAAKVLAVIAAFIVWTQRKASLELPDSDLLDAADVGYATWQLAIQNEKGVK